MIELNRITKSFGDEIIFNNFSLHVEKNEFVAILGKSGSGKTTLLNLMGSLEKPDSGTISIMGVTNPFGKKLMLLRRYNIGYIFQHYFLLENETVYENLKMGAIYNKKIDKDRIDKIITEVGLEPSFLDKKVYKLSGGQQQRVAFARIMLKPCEIILADEPTGNLDTNNKELIISLLNHLKDSGKTIICVTHDKEVATNSDRILDISN
ncbi:ABC transporter ATP-binding protein [Salsuginibacillus kocurii]|uniref:ABC transporter ATP-binding protein n=1 Tax=Salsuginibacillus kocurii TaxID=427078 RepID=UPI000361F5A7|nr:ABC transporter ATP-binding protein [Salsuginibacillus kocurii]